jgi:PiT family inorganic phosphate transporter
VTVAEGVRGEAGPNVSVGALTAENPGEDAPPIGAEDPDDTPGADDLFDPGTTGRVIVMQNVVPLLSTVGAYAAFWALFTYVW